MMTRRCFLVGVLLGGSSDLNEVHRRRMREDYERQRREDEERRRRQRDEADPPRNLQR